MTNAGIREVSFSDIEPPDKERPCHSHIVHRLFQSIVKYGQVMPLMVRDRGEKVRSKRYFIVDGNHRYWALAMIHAVLSSRLSDASKVVHHNTAVNIVVVPDDFSPIMDD